MKKIVFSISLLFLFVIYANAQNKRNVIIEDLTSTGCGHCPCMDSMLEHYVIPLHPNTIIIAYHGIGSAYWQPFLKTTIDSLKFQMSPTVFVDRTGDYYGPDTITDYVGYRYITSPDGNVKINVLSSIYNTSTRQLDLNLSFKPYNANLSGDFYTNLVITESNIIGYQQHFPECPGGDYYNHKNAARTQKYTIGELLHSGIWNQGDSVIKQFSIQIDTSWVDYNCDFVSYVYKLDTSLNTSQFQQGVKRKVYPSAGINYNCNESFDFSIFPNPAFTLSHIQFYNSSSSNIKIEIYDISGRLILNVYDGMLDQGHFNAEFDASLLKSGTYICVISNGKFASTKEFIVQ